MKQIQRICIAFVVLCGLFAQAQVTGSGTTNYLPLWTGSSALGNSDIFQNGGNVGIDTKSPQWALDVAGHINTSAGYRIAELLVLTENAGSYNLAVGSNTLPSVGDGLSTGYSTAVGVSALEANSSGGGNTAVGAKAMQANTTGAYNTAVGDQALELNTTAGFNTAVGTSALVSSTGAANTAVGYAAMGGDTNMTGIDNTAMGNSAAAFITTGSYNTLLGSNSGQSLSSGSSNIGLGSWAGSNVTTGSYNIDIASEGTSSDSGVVRFGTAGEQTSFFAAGIRGVTTGENNAVAVVIDSNGQLGTVSSSRRFKTDIQDMGEASRALLRLRPVTFRYRRPYSDGSQPIQYGLIAEEVADVFPDLVAYGNDGQPESVKYQLLDSLLLNEVQRQQAELQGQQNQLQRQQTEIQDLRDKLTRMEAVLGAASPAAQAQLTKARISETAVQQADRQ